MKLYEILKKFPPEKSKVLTILEAIQAASERHYICSADIKEVASYLNISLSAVYGVAKYYSMLNTSPKGRYVISICASPVCNVRKSCSIRKIISNYIHLNEDHVSADEKFSLDTVECLGHCDKAPVIMINGEIYGNLTEEKTVEIIEYIIKNDHLPLSQNYHSDFRHSDKAFILKRTGEANTLSLTDYTRESGMLAFEKCLGTNRDKIIQEVIDSGLRGRGGAGFPTGLKWKYTAESINNEKFAICNADEGEPGTFKDRPIIEEQPFKFLEGLMIAAYCIKASKAYIYIRGEYTKSIEVVKNAIGQLYEKAWLGKNIKDSGFDLDIEIFVGAGSYLCGDELTLIESMEGKRGNPRFKPPFPAEKGLFGKPTLVNNVETLASIPFIVNNGAVGFRKLGTEKSPGTKIFPISGDIAFPGFYEVEMGTLLQDLIYDYAGGIKDKKDIGFILIGGAAGTFVALKDIENLRLDYDSLLAKNYVLGSGAIMVFNNEKSILKMLYSILKFFKHESCGKCVPCRVGCVQLVMLLKEIMNSDDVGLRSVLLEKMLKESIFMADTSLCALGQSPVLAIRSAYNNYLENLISDKNK